MDGNHHLVTEPKARKRTRSTVNLQLKLCAHSALNFKNKRKPHRISVRIPNYRWANSLNGVFGKLPSHQMAVAIMRLIGKEIREIHFGHRALPYILCAYKYIQCL